MDHSNHAESHTTGSSMGGIVTVLIITFAPVILTLSWVIFISSTGR